MIIQIIQHKDICAKSRHNAIPLSNNNPLPMRTYQQDKHNPPLFFFDDPECVWPLRIIVLQIEFDAKIVKTLRHDVMPDQKAVCLSLHSKCERRGWNILPSLLNLVQLQKTLGDSRSNPCEQRQTRRCKKITMYLIDFWHKSGPDIFPLSLFFF